MAILEDFIWGFYCGGEGKKKRAALDELEAGICSNTGVKWAFRVVGSFFDADGESEY